MQKPQRHAGSVLIVDDDAILASLYRIKLQAAGFVVEVAQSGEAGLLSIAQQRPDLIVLDLMLGDMNGLDFLRMLRRNDATVDIPVIVFSSAFLGGVIEDATRLGAKKCLNKGSCPPNRLIDEIQLALNGPSFIALSGDSAQKPGGTVAPLKAMLPPVGAAQPAVPPSAAAQLPADEVQGSLRHELLAQIDQSADEAVRVLPKWTANPKNTNAPYLSALYRNIRAIAASARLADRHPQAHLAGALEVLLQEVRRTPDKLTPSMLRTVTEAVNYLPSLAGATEDPQTGFGLAPLIVVVDDSEEARDVLRLALARANLPSVCLGTSEDALRLFQWNQVDLAILDVEMPGMNGLELAQRMRDSTPNTETPYIFVSGSTDVEARANRLGLKPAGIIPKPFPAIELAVKALVAFYSQRTASVTPANS